ncbi:hypothetical protein BGZ81_000152 [Podila clonocystis]|nr:hypothetical protein BGZ81_000152 [Podila clonocystis]
MATATCFYTDCLSYYTDFLVCTSGSDNVTEAMLPCLCTPKVIGEYATCQPCLKANQPTTTILTVDEYKDGCAKKDLSVNPYPTGYHPTTTVPTPTGTYSGPPRPSNTGTDSKSGGSNVGLYAGIGGGVAAVILIVGLFFFYRNKKPKNGKVNYAVVPSGAGAGAAGAGAAQHHGPPPPMQQVYPQNYSQQHQQQYQQQYTPDQQQLQQQQLQQQQLQQHQLQQQYQQQQFEQQAQHAPYAPPVTQPATSSYYANNQQGYYPTPTTAPTTVPQPTPSPTFVPANTQYQTEAVASINNAQIYHANTSDYQNQQHVPLPGQNYQAQSSVYSPTIATNISSPTVVDQNVLKPETSPAHQQEPKAKPGPQLYERETQYTAQSNNPQYIDPNASYH